MVAVHVIVNRYKTKRNELEYKIIQNRARKELLGCRKYHFIVRYGNIMKSF